MLVPVAIAIGFTSGLSDLLTTVVDEAAVAVRTRNTGTSVHIVIECRPMNYSLLTNFTWIN
jgi:hypothetical protein